VQPPSQNWQSLVQLLTSRSPELALRCQSAQVELTNSLLDSLCDDRIAASQQQLQAGQQLHSELTGLINQLSAFEKISRCPILGITGILNSGKSSLLATFLSQDGRNRVLRGLSNAAGTHRFVLWLPQRWREESGLTEPLQAFLAQLFGHVAEPLSDDPEMAARQYNGHMCGDTTVNVDPISVPLIAFDPGLNELHLGLLDCPDIQTGFAIGRSGPESDVQVRQRWLSVVGRLCAAFVVMTKLNSLHDQVLINILTLLRDSMPGVPRILTVNRVKARYSPDVVAQQAQSIVDRFGISSVYAAYDFRSALADTRVPPRPDGMQPESDGSPQPIFFQVAQSTPKFDSANFRYLFHLGKQLDVGVLAAESNRSLVQQLKTRVLHLIEWHQRNPEMRKAQVTDAWHAIASACYEFMAERDGAGKCVGLRLQTSPAIVAQLSESLRRTAPMWMKLSLSIDKTARQLQQAIAAKTEKIKLMQNASQAVADFVKRFRRGEGAQVVTPDTVSRSIRSFDIHDAFQRFSDEELTKDCASGLARFSAEDQPQLDEKALDQWSQAIWDNMPLSTKLRRGVQPLALITGPLLAALLVPFDGGGSAVLVFASTKELLAAAGLAALVTPIAGGGQTLKIVNEETPWKQLSDLFAILCDSVGLARPNEELLPSCGSSPRRLLPSRTSLETRANEYRLSLWEPAQGALAQLQSVVQRC
jgi:hypothetical protein